MRTTPERIWLQWHGDPDPSPKPDAADALEVFCSECGGTGVVSCNSCGDEHQVNCPKCTPERKAKSDAH